MASWSLAVAALAALASLAASGCVESQATSDEQTGDPPCPPLRPATYRFDVEAHNVTIAGGFSSAGPYRDMPWAMKGARPERITAHARWTAELPFDTKLVVRLTGIETGAQLAMASGPSPLDIDLAYAGDEPRGVRIWVEPWTEPGMPVWAGVAREDDVRVTVTQAFGCHARA